MPSSEKELERGPSASLGDEKTDKLDTDAQDEHEQVDEDSSQCDDPKLTTRRSRSSSRSRHLTRQQSALSVIRNRNPAYNRPFTHKLERQPTGPDVVVRFDGPNDPYRPLNWPFKKKAITTALYGFTTMGSTFASSVYSAGVGQISHDFHVANVVSTLGISLMLLGFGLGPLIWAPLSEVYGRKQAVLLPCFVAAVFSFGTATAKDIQTVMITRFFAGFFGAAPITNTGGVLGDLWAPKQRGLALVGYAFAVVGGPIFGPIVGGAVCLNENLRWRWTEYITGIYMLSVLVIDYCYIDESYPAVLLVYKARRLRISSGNWALHAKHEEWDVSLRDLIHKYLVRPFQMLGTPICFLVALYASFVYGILYANLAAFPVAFQEVRGWNLVVGALPFLSVLVGIMLGAIPTVLNQKYYFKRLQQNDGKPVPEARLPPMMFGAVSFSAGLFLFAWTSSPHVFWFPSQVGGVLIGMGFFGIFQGALNYLVDTFTKYGASAVAANTFLRSCFAAAFPLFMAPMLHNLGVDWGVSIFAFISVIMIPIPYFFFVFGKRIRARGYWSKESVE